MTNTAGILIAVPTRGAIGWATVTRLQEIRDAQPGLPPVVYQPGGVSVALTRNKIVRRFLTTDCDALLMVDDDIIPPPNVLELVEHLDDYGMVAVPQPMPHPLKPDAVMLSIYDRHPDGYRFHEGLQAGPAQVDAVGTGCVLIRRDVFDAVGDAPFRVDNDPSATVAGEDFLFCEDMAAAGFKVGYVFPDGQFCDHQTVVSLAPLFKANLAEPAPLSSIILPDGLNRGQRRQLARAR